MASQNTWRAARAALILFIGVALTVWALSTSRAARADTPDRPFLQDTSYPGENATLPPFIEGTSYPVMDTPISNNPTLSPSPVTPQPGAATATRTKTPTRTNTFLPGTPSPTLSASGGTVTSTPTVETPLVDGLTVTPLVETLTLPNVFLTENAEMGGSQVTPPPSETPEETRQPTATHTPTRTRTPRPTIVAAEQQGDFPMEWGPFWIGFALPVLLACGFVIYLLDHRPELFSLRKN